MSNKDKWEMLIAKKFIYKTGKYIQDIFQERQAILSESKWKQNGIPIW